MEASAALVHHYLWLYSPAFCHLKVREVEVWGVHTMVESCSRTIRNSLCSQHNIEPDFQDDYIQQAGYVSGYCTP